MKRSLQMIMLGCALMAAGAVNAQEGPTPYPDPKDDAAWPGSGPIRRFEWMSTNRDFFWTQREKARDAVVFVGDSLIGNWKGPLLSAAFPELKTANRGIGGDVTRGVLFRLKEDVLDLNPKAVVLCIGTNDLSAHGDPQTVSQNIALIVDQAAARNPAMPVVVCTIPPRANPKAPLKRAAVVTELNTAIRALAAARKNVVVFDLFAALSTPEGAPNPEYFNSDLLHPAPAGYVEWGKRLAPVLSSVVPPAAKTVSK